MYNAVYSCCDLPGLEIGNALSKHFNHPKHHRKNPVSDDERCCCGHMVHTQGGMWNPLKGAEGRTGSQLFKGNSLS